MKLTLAKTLDETIERLNNDFGWNLNPSDKTLYMGDDGYIYYNVDQESVHGYTVCIDPETGKSCSKGNGSGCFWTEWE